MGLATYKRKRDFEKTAEPEGTLKKKSGSLVFVVQKHAASHLHYDFRLEMEGVLKSWAVPKGPSMNPADKRLAMMVEDHPYSYKDFEGNIPAGNYGAGNVIVWDNGTYAPLSNGSSDDEKILLEGLRKGRLSFILKGKKLKGEFSLVKMHNAGENAWLLMKKNDEYATTDDILKKEQSVISRNTLADLDERYATKKNKAASEKGRATAKKKSTKATKQEKPQKVKPMLATLVSEPFNNADWLFEIKYDGYRALAAMDGNGEVDLFSRNFLSFNEVFKSIVEELKNITQPCLLDGEVVVLDDKGHSHFQLLQNYQSSTRAGNLRYYVFDLLSLDGEDTKLLSLAERKTLLKLLLEHAKLDKVIYSEHIKEKGVDFYQLAKQKELEGIIGKDSRSLYRPGKRTGEWVKIKITQEQEAIIAGITEPKGSRNYFGSLLLGVMRKDKLQYIGLCGTGFNQGALKSLYEKFKPLFTDDCPFEKKPQINKKIQWLKPKLVCQAKFTEWTQDGIMRNPVFLGLRKDKSASEVKKEIPLDSNAKDMKRAKKTRASAIPAKRTKTTEKTNAASKKNAGEFASDYEKKVGSITLKLTNQNKIYWPDEKITKGDLVKYYDQIAPLILPYLKDRPQSLHRFPDGIKKPGFYQKDLDTSVIPKWVRTEKVYSESNKENIDYLICNDKATLIYMANLGCIEINPWNSTIKNINNPNWVVIDLDPEDIAFKEVVRAALETKKVLDELEVPCFCKTSGATGLHIYIPLNAKYDYEKAKHFTKLVAMQVNALLPETTSIERMPAKRRKKVYLDFLQNNFGQTLAAPYSVRPQPGATVSTPLGWSEVNMQLDPSNYTMKSILARLDKKGDLWKGVLGKGINLSKSL